MSTVARDFVGERDVWLFEDSENFGRSYSELFLKLAVRMNSEKRQNAPINIPFATF
jgi:hypothetical protein